MKNIFLLHMQILYLSRHPMMVMKFFMSICLYEVQYHMNILGLGTVLDFSTQANAISQCLL